MKLWIGNIEPGTPGEELREFVRKYAPDPECTKIQRVGGTVRAWPRCSNSRAHRPDT
jgi:hypothetical protein